MDELYLTRVFINYSTAVRLCIFVHSFARSLGVLPRQNTSPKHMWCIDTKKEEVNILSSQLYESV